jgi:hypothetical protein
VLIGRNQQNVAHGLPALLNATTPLFTRMVAHALAFDEELTTKAAARCCW